MLARGVNNGTRSRWSKRMRSSSGITPPRSGVSMVSSGTQPRSPSPRVAVRAVAAEREAERPAGSDVVEAPRSFFDPAPSVACTSSRTATSSTAARTGAAPEVRPSARGAIVDQSQSRSRSAEPTLAGLVAARSGSELVHSPRRTIPPLASRVQNVRVPSERASLEAYLSAAGSGST